MTVGAMSRERLLACLQNQFRTCIEKGQPKKRWKSDSSSFKEKEQAEAKGIPILCEKNLQAKVTVSSCNILRYTILDQALLEPLGLI